MTDITLHNRHISQPFRIQYGDIEVTFIDGTPKECAENKNTPEEIDTVIKIINEILAAAPYAEAKHRQ